MEIGTASSSPGELNSGWLEVTGLPTGGVERLPVSIREGADEGPTLWVTAALHGDEVTGIGVAQDFMRRELSGEFEGTVVCIPTLNPSGVRVDGRNSYYHDEDPNRYYPYDVGVESGRPRVQQLICERVFEEFERTADALVSLHEGWINESLYTIVERVRFGRDRTREEALTLSEETVALAEAFGLPLINEYEVEVQEELGLQRSFECAAVNAAGVPAITAELGSPHIIEDRYLEAAVEGVHNVMCALGMRPDDPCDIEAPPSPVDYPVKRVDGPVTETPGIVRHRVEAGDVVSPGDVVAEITTPHGEVKDTVHVEEEGYILGRRHGVAVYENDVLVSMAARDDGERVERHS